MYVVVSILSFYSIEWQKTLTKSDHRACRLGGSRVWCESRDHLRTKSASFRHIQPFNQTSVFSVSRAHQEKPESSECQKLQSQSLSTFSPAFS